MSPANTINFKLENELCVQKSHNAYFNTEYESILVNKRAHCGKRIPVPELGDPLLPPQLNRILHQTCWASLCYPCSAIYIFIYIFLVACLDLQTIVQTMLPVALEKSLCKKTTLHYLTLNVYNSDRTSHEY